MDSSRREFLKTTTLVTGALVAGSTEVGRAAVPTGEDLAAQRLDLAQAAGSSPRPAAAAYMGGFRAKPIKTIRFGMIGVGGRGTSHLDRLVKLEGCQVRAIADISLPNASRAKKLCPGPAAELYTDGDYDYRRLLSRDDIDAVIISTPWRWHVPMAVDAMNAGKHAFVEVPIAYTLEDCWKLVDTAEQTRRHCMMMENVNYGRDELLFLNLCRQGVIGPLTHGEAAYIHDLRDQMQQLESGGGSWRTIHHTIRNGNMYPTHGLGPIAQYMNIDRTEDRFAHLVSFSSPALGRAEYAQHHFDADHQRNEAQYLCGDMNTSIIKTRLGRTIMLQWDTTTPRPYSRHNLIQGTRGCLKGYPLPTQVAIQGRGNTHEWQDPPWEQFEHPLWKRIGDEASRVGGHGGMDFVMLWRIVQCLHEGLPLDQNVYEGCSWSAVSPLSEISVAQGGAPTAFPDFTRGDWKTTDPLPIVS